MTSLVDTWLFITTMKIWLSTRSLHNLGYSDASFSWHVTFNLQSQGSTPKQPSLSLTRNRVRDAPSHPRPWGSLLFHIYPGREGVADGYTHREPFYRCFKETRWQYAYACRPITRFIVEFTGTYRYVSWMRQSMQEMCSLLDSCEETSAMPRFLDRVPIDCNCMYHDYISVDNDVISATCRHFFFPDYSPVVADQTYTVLIVVMQ